MTSIYLVHRDSLSCEATVRQMPNGELLMVCQCNQCRGTKEPSIENRVFYWHSKDNGKTWDEPTQLWPEDGRAVYQTEVSVIDGEVTVFLALHDGGFWDLQCMMMKSTDNGYSWYNAGEPPCFSNYTFFRGIIQTKDNCLVQSYQRYPVSEKVDRNFKWKSEMMSLHADVIPYNENGIIRSDDGGKTWKSYPAITLEHRERWHWGEPTICELESDHLVMLVRVNDSGYLWRSDSLDGGKTWCHAFKTEIPNPNNKVKLIKMPNENIALLHTPATGNRKGATLEDRNPLELWISDDGMKSWNYKRTLIDFPGAVSYPDGFCTTDGRHIMLSVEFNRHDIYFLDHEIEN